MMIVFGVVADEIKSLAGETAEATEDIETRIAGVQSRTNDPVEGVQETRDRVEVGAETIGDAIGMFDDIADAIDETERGIKEISNATDDQAASSEEVVSMVDGVFRVSENAAAEASETSAATEEQASSLSDSSQNVQHLSQLADELHAQNSNFELRPSSTEETSVSYSGGDVSSPATTDGGYPSRDEPTAPELDDE